jgi:cytoskeletal protein RodZ
MQAGDGPDDRPAADDQADGAGTPVDQRPAWRTVLGGLPWKRLVVIAVGLFVAAMATILAFELATGRAVSTYTGGSDQDGPRTSFGGSAEPDRDEPKPTKSPESTPADPTTTPAESTPTTAETTTPPEEAEDPATTTAPTTTPPATTPPAPTPSD